MADGFRLGVDGGNEADPVLKSIYGEAKHLPIGTKAWGSNLYP